MTPDKKTVDFEILYIPMEKTDHPGELKHILEYLPEILKEMNRQAETKEQE